MLSIENTILQQAETGGLFQTMDQVVAKMGDDGKAEFGDVTVEVNPFGGDTRGDMLVTQGDKSYLYMDGSFYEFDADKRAEINPDNLDEYRASLQGQRGTTVVSRMSNALGSVDELPEVDLADSESIVTRSLQSKLDHIMRREDKIADGETTEVFRRQPDPSARYQQSAMYGVTRAGDSLTVLDLQNDLQVRYEAAQDGKGSRLYIKDGDEEIEITDRNSEDYRTAFKIFDEVQSFDSLTRYYYRTKDVENTEE